MNACWRDLKAIEIAANKTERWAQKYFDSNGVKPAGAMSGNMRWLGDLDQCRGIGKVHVDDFGGIDISPQYCRLELVKPNEIVFPGNVNPRPAGLNVGVCVSSRCTVEDLGPVIAPMIKQTGQNLTLSVESSRCIVDDVPYSPIAIATLVIFSFLALLQLIGLTIDLKIRLTAWWRARQNPNASASQSASPATNKLVKSLLCFSPYTNFVKLLAVPGVGSNNTPNLSAFNGIRALSLFWVVLGHVYVFNAFMFDNIGALFGEMLQRISFLFIFAGEYAVDTFLFMSAFLAYWSLWKQLKKLSFARFLQAVPFLYFHRYVRLTPPFIGILLIDLGLWAHFANGPFYFQGTDYNCAKNFWTNLLYINNIVDVPYQCLGWSWYLAVDMQLFLFVPFIVYLFVKKPALGWCATIGALLLETALLITLTLVYNMPLLHIGVPPNYRGKNITDHKDYANSGEIIDIKSYTRMAPYIIGLMCAHVVVNHGKFFCEKVFPKIWLSTLTWLLMFGIMLTLTYGHHGVIAGDYYNPTYADVIYNINVSRAWALAISWLFLACIFNYAGPIGDILSWPVWALFARLSYAIYLIHPLVLTFYGQTSRRPLNLTDITVIVTFSACMFVSFLLAIPFTLVFESPIVGLQHIFISSKAARSNNHSDTNRNQQQPPQQQKPTASEILMAERSEKL